MRARTLVTIRVAWHVTPCTPMPPLASQRGACGDCGDTPGGWEQLLPNPWPALWAMMVGFMIMLDSTVVVIANPTIMAQLRIGYATVVWVNSSCLACWPTAVPLAVAGRLGDRLGPEESLPDWPGVFTAASLGCGLSMVPTLIAAEGARRRRRIATPADAVDDNAGSSRSSPQSRCAWGHTVASVAQPGGTVIGGALVDSMGGRIRQRSAGVTGPILAA